MKLTVWCGMKFPPNLHTQKTGLCQVGQERLMTMTIMTSLLYTTATLLLTTCVGSLYAQTQMFISARVGSSAVLPCDWRNVSSQNPHIEWRTYAETVFERRGGDLYQGEGYEGRVDVPEDHLLKGDCSLLLKNVRPEDEGIYESHLLVKQTKGAVDSKWVYLQSVELSVDGKTKISRTTLLTPDLK
ncbi:hypothetical protein MHYP_G00170490 [Metynnis hypsauchen]